jgi:fructose transport system substrate-binding protein
MRRLSLVAWTIFVVASLLLSACTVPAAAPAAEPAAATEPAAEEAAAPEAAAEGEAVQVALITKHRGNPFFVKMEEGATAEAESLGLELLTAAGEFDGDNESQVTAIENMINAGVRGILLVANDSSAIVPTVQKAREAAC